MYTIETHSKMKYKNGTWNLKVTQKYQHNVYRIQNCTKKFAGKAPVGLDIGCELGALLNMWQQLRKTLILEAFKSVL